MRVNTEQRTLETNIDAAPTGFKIQASAKMFQILSSGLYSNKALAIVRELTANAIDAHVAAGTTKIPFRIHFPTALEPWFEIEDQGTGLSEDDIHQLYCTYGGSDKTMTDDLIGGFGLGSKSPFAYTDQFTVTSRHNDAVRTYAIYISADGTPQVMKTEERFEVVRPGLTVNIGVASKDCSDFHEAGEQVLPYVENVPFNANIGIDKPRYTMRVEIPGTGAHYRVREDGIYSINVVQGCVRYNTSNNDCPELSDWLPGIDVYVPINTLDVAVSRETIAYTERTRKWFKDVGVEIRKLAKQQIWDQLAGLSTIADRTAFLMSITNYHTQSLIEDKMWDPLPKLTTGLQMLNATCDSRRKRNGGYAQTVSFSFYDPQHKNFGDPSYTKHVVGFAAKNCYWSERQTWVKPHINALRTASTSPASGTYEGLVIVGDKKNAIDYFTSIGIDKAKIIEVPKPPKKQRVPGAARAPLVGAYYARKIGDGCMWMQRKLEEDVLDKSPDRLLIVDRDAFNEGYWVEEVLMQAGHKFDDIWLVDIPESHTRVRARLIDEEDAEVVTINSTNNVLAFADVLAALDATRDDIYKIAVESAIDDYTEPFAEKYLLNHWGSTPSELLKEFSKFDGFKDFHKAVKTFCNEYHNKRIFRDRLNTVVKYLLDDASKTKIKAAGVNRFEAQIKALNDAHGEWMLKTVAAIQHVGAHDRFAPLVRQVIDLQKQLQTANEQLAECMKGHVVLNNHQEQLCTPISSVETPLLSTLPA